MAKSAPSWEPLQHIQTNRLITYDLQPGGDCSAVLHRKTFLLGASGSAERPLFEHVIRFQSASEFHAWLQSECLQSNPSFGRELSARFARCESLRAPGAGST